MTKKEYNKVIDAIYEMDLYAYDKDQIYDVLKSLNLVEDDSHEETIQLSVIEDIKAEIKSLYSYYGDGSGWEKSRNITLDQVMSIIDEHTSGKEQT